MTNANNDRAIALAAKKEEILGFISKVQARDAIKVTCVNALRRSRDYCAFFATNYFAECALDFDIDLTSLAERCDKTRDRMRHFLQATKDGAFYLRNASDQNRYSYTFIKTMVNAHNAKVAILSRDDANATATKGAIASEYVVSIPNTMSQDTATRQGGIATYILEDLGFCEFNRVGKNITGYKPKPKSAFFKHVAKMVKAEQTALNS